MTQVPLTRRQRQILDFYEQYVRRNGISPTLEEVAQHQGVSKVTIFGHVAELERKGILSRAAKGISRGLQVVQPAPSRTRKIALLGNIAAGRAIEAIEIPETLDLQELIPPGTEVYALTVRGNSMIDDSIRDGDTVLVERRSDARNGETVVAILEGGSATLKRFYREDGHIRLQPANASMPPIVVRDVEIRGVVIGIIRRL